MTAREDRLFLGRETVAAAVLGALLLVAFGPTLVEIVQKCWHYPEYGHGLLMLPIAAWLVWDRRRELAAMRRTPRGAALPLLAAGALVFLAAALVLGEMKLSWFLKAYAFVGALVACIALLYGWRGLKALAKPLVVLALACPVPWRVINAATVPLKRHAAVLATGLTDVSGIDVSLEGNLIHVPGIDSLMVADACSGVRSLISLLAIAIVGCLFWKRHWTLKVVLVAACVPISVLVNGMRIWASAMISVHISPELANDVWGHQAEGLVLFGVAALVLLAFGWLLHRLVPRAAGRDAGDADVSAPAAALPPGGAAYPRIAFALAVVLLAVASYGAYRIRGKLGDERPDPAAVRRLQASLDRLPTSFAGLRGEVKEWDEHTVAYSGADAYRSIVYRDRDDRSYEIYVASAYRNDENFHTPNVCMPSSAWEMLDAGTAPFAGSASASSGAPPRVRRLVLQKGKDRMLVYYWFQAGDRMASSEWAVRWFRLVDLWGDLVDPWRDVPLPPTTIVTLYVPVRGGLDATEEAARGFLRALAPYLNEAISPESIHG